MEWSANYARALTLKARVKKALDKIWDTEPSDIESDEAAQSL